LFGIGRIVSKVSREVVASSIREERKRQVFAAVVSEPISNVTPGAVAPNSYDDVVAFLDCLISEFTLFSGPGRYSKRHLIYVLSQESPIDLDPFPATASACCRIEDDKVAVH
jgi:hypothetical protein